MFRSGWNSIDQFNLIKIGIYVFALSIKGHEHIGVNTFYFNIMIERGLALCF